ncbi:hypothetical protein PAPYR_2350 [Paratrimastix pyriformis]|uniref:Uncharacterized protein n=1 Tax=Paratrimastix pyriformis TaxID=342808 RepID=A0ABQ8UQ60_9EUKA|nr:hypothetical protein PAPYR_2350 [Paratrimastix pyriformis]
MTGRIIGRGDVGADGGLGFLPASVIDRNDVVSELVAQPPSPGLQHSRRQYQSQQQPTNYTPTGPFMTKKRAPEVDRMYDLRSRDQRIEKKLNRPVFVKAQQPLSVSLKKKRAQAKKQAKNAAPGLHPLG